MPLWLQIVLGTLTPVAAGLGLVIGRFDARRAHRAERQTRQQEELSDWRTDALALRARFTAEQEENVRVRNDMQAGFGLRDLRIRELERAIADGAVNLQRVQTELAEARADMLARQRGIPP